MASEEIQQRSDVDATKGLTKQTNNLTADLNATYIDVDQKKELLSDFEEK